jgi:hypothetical protein
MNKFRSAIGVLAVLALATMLTACATPLDENGLNNRTAVTELITLSKAAGFKAEASPKRDCEVPLGCEDRQQFSAWLEEGPTSLSVNQGCRKFVAFLRDIKANRYDSMGSEPPIDDLVSNLNDDGMISACEESLALGLTPPDFSETDRQDSISVSASGSHTTASGAEVPYGVQFSAYATKTGERGFSLYIWAGN